MAIGVGKLSIKATPKATIGKITNCEKKPTKKSLGTLNILTKSFTDKPSPSPSIINAKQIGAILVTISILYLDWGTAGVAHGGPTPPRGARVSTAPQTRGQTLTIATRDRRAA